MRGIPVLRTKTPERMRTPEAAAYTGLSVSFLTKLRVFGGGPKYLKLGRRVVYEQAALNAWMGARRHTSTSEYAADLVAA
jgi:predicted DNA-binding transcriptional regulator AlpA